MVQRALTRQKVDPTLLRYAGSIVTVTLNVVLVVGILGYFGVQTTSSLRCSQPPASRSAWRGPVCSPTSRLVRS